jgi:hypothetical protein
MGQTMIEELKQGYTLHYETGKRTLKLFYSSLLAKSMKT